MNLKKRYYQLSKEEFTSYLSSLKNNPLSIVLYQDEKNYFFYYPEEEINKKIQALQEKRDKLEGSITSSKGKNTLSKEQAKNLLSGFKDRDKIIGKGKDPLTDPSVINQRIQKLAAELDRTGKT